MKILLPAAAAAILFCIMSSCGVNSERTEVGKLAMKVPGAEKKHLVINKEDAGNGSGQPEFSPEGQKQDPGQKKQQPAAYVPVNQDWDKKIIKTASLNLEVKDYNNYYISLREKIRAFGGYVAQEEQHQSGYKIENSMIVKVPVDQFDNAITQLTAGAAKINERKTSSQDVTTEVIDTRSRLEARKQVRQRYMDLMNQAKNMEEILQVQSEINGIQEEIESASGLIQYLSHASAFSTINLTYYQVLDVAAKGTAEDTAPSFGKKVQEALETGWEIVSAVCIAVISIWPLLLATLFAYVLYKKMKTQKVKRVNDHL